MPELDFESGAAHKAHQLHSKTVPFTGAVWLKDFKATTAADARVLLISIKRFHFTATALTTKFSPLAVDDRIRIITVVNGTLTYTIVPEIHAPDLTDIHLNVLDRYNELLFSSKRSDFNIIVESVESTTGNVIPAHGIILETQPDYFAKIFESSMSEASTKSRASPTTLFSHSPKNVSDAIELFRAADYFGIQMLGSMVEGSFVDDLSDLKYLRQMCLRVMLANKEDENLIGEIEKRGLKHLVQVAIDPPFVG
ncbi:hypothetical protein BJ742DRAFT_769589 [Cladochytrium replicatum]|nr:hypothetical protein BJ742DRAFT_769589 [Cladochytrium replicatum]